MSTLLLTALKAKLLLVVSRGIARVLCLKRIAVLKSRFMERVYGTKTMTKTTESTASSESETKASDCDAEDHVPDNEQLMRNSSSLDALVSQDTTFELREEQLLPSQDQSSDLMLTIDPSIMYIREYLQTVGSLSDEAIFDRMGKQLLMFSHHLKRTIGLTLSFEEFAYFCPDEQRCDVRCIVAGPESDPISDYQLLSRRPLCVSSKSQRQAVIDSLEFQTKNREALLEATGGRLSLVSSYLIEEQTQTVLTLTPTKENACSISDLMRYLAESGQSSLGKSESFEILSQLEDILVGLRSMQVVHGAVKPRKVLIDTQGQVSLKGCNRMFSHTNQALEKYPSFASKVRRRLTKVDPFFEILPSRVLEDHQKDLLHIDDPVGLVGIALRLSGENGKPEISPILVESIHTSIREWRGQNKMSDGMLLGSLVRSALSQAMSKI